MVIILVQTDLFSISTRPFVHSRKRESSTAKGRDQEGRDHPASKRRQCPCSRLGYPNPHSGSFSLLFSNPSDTITRCRTSVSHLFIRVISSVFLCTCVFVISAIEFRCNCYRIVVMILSFHMCLCYFFCRFRHSNFLNRFPSLDVFIHFCMWF